MNTKQFTEDFTAIALGVILISIIPWGYVFRHYLKEPGAHKADASVMQFPDQGRRVRWSMGVDP